MIYQCRFCGHVPNKHHQGGYAETICEGAGWEQLGEADGLLRCRCRRFGEIPPEERSTQESGP